MKVFRIQASVMSSVLVVSTLMFIGMLGVLFLWDSEHLLAARYFFREQQRAHLLSAVVKYCQDTSFCIGFRQDTSLMLFPGLATSEVGFYRKRWGLYEMLLLTAGDEKKCCLMGKVDEGYSRAALYLPERGRTLSIAGKSRIEGKLYIGGQGVAYTQVRSEFFDGTPVAPSDICRSGEMLPSPAPEITAYVGELFRYAIEEWPEAENFGQATFAGPVEYRRIGQEIKAMGLTGPYVLCAADSLYIRGDCRLRGVIIVAGKVRIGTGFKGAVQVFARDAIGLEERVVLQAGSGLWVNGGTRWRSVRLGENCRVDGYVVVRGNTEQPQSPYAHYHQPSSAVVRGLVYVDGIADVRGVVEGSLYAGELCHFASEGYYADLFYNVSVCRSPGTVYPFLIKGPVERREVK